MQNMSRAVVPRLLSLLSLHPHPFGTVMAKSRSQQLSEKARDEERRCRDWLLPFMQGGHPKFLTKDELREAAMRELKISNNSFDFAWIATIEDTGRHDWYEPLRRGYPSKN